MPVQLAGRRVHSPSAAVPPIASPQTREVQRTNRVRIAPDPLPSLVRRPHLGEVAEFGDVVDDGVVMLNAFLRNKLGLE